MVKKSVSIALIAAMDKNQVIGKNNTLIWDIPEDLKWFRHITAGKPVTMGRNTYESILAIVKMPLPKRHNIVITRQKDYHPGDFDHVSVTHSVEEAIELAQASAQKNDLDEIFIIGGEQIYRAALDKADIMYLTHIDHTYEGDAYFPKFNENEWDIQNLNHFDQTEKTPAFTIKKYTRKLIL